MKRTNGFWALLLLLLGCVVPIASAATFVGTIDEDWFKAGNWDTGIVPAMSDGQTNTIAADTLCKVSGGDATCLNLKLVNLSNLVVDPNATFLASGYIYLSDVVGQASSLTVGDPNKVDLNRNTITANSFMVGFKGVGEVTFNNCVFVPYMSPSSPLANFFIGREMDAHGTVTFKNSILSPYNSDGSANYVTFAMAVFGTNSTGTGTLNLIDSEVTVGRYYNAGQCGTAYINIDNSTLNVFDRFQIGSNSGAPYMGNGHLNMSSGTINVNGWMGVRTGTVGRISTATATGGTINVSGNLLIGSKAIVNFGGSMSANLGSITMQIQEIGDPNEPPVVNFYGNAEVTCGALTIDTGVLDLADTATLTISGDVRSHVNGYIDTGKITGGGIYRKVTVVYDELYDQTVLSLGSDELLKKAYLPVPVNGVNTYRNYTDLSWQAGQGAVSHTLYISTNSEEVINASIAPAYTGTETSYMVSGVFEPATYYWRVDEYDGMDTTSGEVWSFTASGVMVDDFEYADTSALLAVWTQGTGASIEMNPEGTDEVLFTYDNTASPYYSEMTRIPPFADFTDYELKSMDVRFVGSEENSSEPIYVTLSDGTNSATVVSAEPLTTQTTWQTLRITSAEFLTANGDLDLTTISTISIGIGDKNNPQAGGTGLVQFGRITLYEARCFTPPAADFSGDCIVGIEDLFVLSQQWLNNNFWPAD